MTDERFDKLTRCAEAASLMCNALPDVVEDFDADVGATALILCGFLASKIVGEGEGLITRDEFILQMDSALAAINSGNHLTEQ